MRELDELRHCGRVGGTTLLLREAERARGRARDR